MKNSKSALKKLITPVLFLFLNFNTYAETITYTNGGGDELWSNPSNWNTASVPGSSDDVLVVAGTLIIDVDVDIKSLMIDNDATVDFQNTGIATIGDLTIRVGELNAVNKIVVNNSLSWTGKSSLISEGVIELSASCVSTISGTGNRKLYAQIINNGTITHTDGSLRFQTDGSLVNNGVYTVDGATFMINAGGGAFTNNGVFNKENSNEVNIFTPFDQVGTGVLNINEGTFKLLANGDLTDNTAITIANGATMDFNSGTYSLGANTSVTGSGEFLVSGGTVTIDGTVSMNGEMRMTGGTTTFDNPNPIPLSKLTLTGGTLDGSSAILINSAFNWSGTASIKSTGGLTLANSAEGLIFTGGTRKLYSVIINDGTISHTDGSIRFYSGAKIENNGTYLLNGPTTMNDNGGDGFENNGAFKHLSTGNVNIKPDFNNNVDGVIGGKGTLKFSNLINLGSFSTEASDGTLNIDGNFDSGAALNIGFDNADYGDLVVDGNALLGGELKVDVIGSIPTGTYKIISTNSGTISGTFDEENVPSNFSILYSTSEVNLQVGLLPVELTRFNANVRIKKVELSWQTASEENSDRFIIEHSLNGIDFIAIGELDAAGTSAVKLDYSYIHERPSNGLNYYRLRQEDQDERFEYSAIRVVSFYNFNEDISVFPNPSHGNVILKNQSDKILKLTIRELGGKVVYVRNEVAPGAISLDLKYLPKGMYTLEFSDGTYFSHKEKLMLLE